ncbi:hypothetical protein CCM_01846 [Cordyceps militaris CM01]|uniref:Uncharacterized protein n=1 Tax=Cordyceps militaris (strain CM01) TaxID=983644 RepID=G3J7X5_CORMM|nr:uncharacterized protein CCM_01846 [Cordyceps militaris CM01]EGX97186.1 hypothetical protein CCM_01846 [Cordyceps militaris CM01]
MAFVKRRLALRKRHITGLLALAKQDGLLLAMSIGTGVGHEGGQLEVPQKHRSCDTSSRQGQALTNVASMEDGEFNGAFYSTMN